MKRAALRLSMLCGLGAMALAPLTSDAQALSRLGFRLEGAGTTLLSSQSDTFGFGYAGRLDIDARLASIVHAHVFAAHTAWGAKDDAVQPASGPARSTIFGLGVGVEPELANRIHLRAEGDLGLSLNGPENDARFAWGLGIGAWFGLADFLDLGPIVRIGGILASDTESTDNGGRGSALFLTFGLGISLHGSETPAAATTIVETEPVIVRAPPPATTTQTVSAPVAPSTISTASLSAAYDIPAPTPTPVAVPVPVPAPIPPAAPVAPTAAPEEEEGRHGRHGRHGRSRRHGGSRHGGSRHGGSHGGGHRRHH